MFYDKTLELMQQAAGTKQGGIYIEGAETVKKMANCDVQPYSAELLLKDYGYKENVTNRVFLDPDTDFETSSIVKYNNKRYKVKRIITWDDHWELMIDDE